MTTTSTAYQSTSSLLSPPPNYLSFSSSSPRVGGILLNAYKSSSYVPSTPPAPTSVLQHYPARAATPNSNSSEDDKSPNAANGTPRKIRFAPLPDPRRAVAVCDDGQEFEMQEDSGTISFGGSKDGSPPRSLEECVMSGRPDSIASTEDDDEDAARLKTRPRKNSWSSATKNLLSPLLGKSPSKGGLLSPDTDDVEDYMSTGLSRRTSTGGLYGANPMRSNREVMRKEDFLGGGSVKASTSTHSDAENGRKHKRAMSADKRRMLNGRIYGGSRNKQQKYEEPEFVEWGYGGMGSQKAAHQSKWGSVGGKSVYTSAVKEVSGGDQEDEDDGSGMAWVRRRRREREEKARQEKERAQQNEAEKENLQEPQRPQLAQAAGKLPASAHSSARTTPTASTLSSAFSSRSHSPQPSNPSGSTTGTNTPHVDGEERHHYTTVSLPPPMQHHHHHHHHHHHKHHGEHGDHRPVPPPLAPIVPGDVKALDFLGAEVSPGVDNTLMLQFTPATPISPTHDDKGHVSPIAIAQPAEEAEEEDDDETESSDESSSDDDADVEDEETGVAVEKKSVASSSTDSDPEDDGAEKARLTSAGAGVEKISTKGRRG